MVRSRSICCQPSLPQVVDQGRSRATLVLAASVIHLDFNEGGWKEVSGIGS